MPDNRSVWIAESLRDFFLARDAFGLVRAFGVLSIYRPEKAPPGYDWKEVEFAFNRLFVGPRALQAPPFASVYLDPEPQLMGQTTVKIRQVYQLLGLTSPWKNKIPDDHLSLELDGYRQLKIALTDVDSEELQALQQYFLKHFQAWVFSFVDQVKKAEDVPGAIIFVVELLAEWLKNEVETVKFGKISVGA